MGFKELLFGKEPDFKVKEVKDPLKESVASPLSRFLSEGIGSGVPRFSPSRDVGGQVLSDLPEGGGSSVSKFLGLDADTFFKENVKDPAIQTFREDLLPLIQEDFAGSLSGSGRLRAESDAARGLARDLAVARGEFGLKLPAAQFDIAVKIKQERDKEVLFQYSDWLKSIPQANPILKDALGFLGQGTSSGTDILSALDPGTKGVFGDLIAVAASIAKGGG